MVFKREDFDLERYLGRWYEIGRYPLIYEEGCTGATADYSLVEGGVRVINTCYTNHQPVRQDKGLARLTPFPGQFNLSFDRFNHAFETPYIVLWTDYDHYAFVGDLENDYYYILSRYSILLPEEYDFIYDRTVNLGFSPQRVIVNLDIL